MSARLSGLPRAARRSVVVALLTILGLTLAAGAASAHVTVNGTATAGGYSKLTFRVPNESPTAKTVEVTVDFPLDTPFASVSVKKTPGWTATATRTKLDTPIDNHGTSLTEAVSSITWKADDAGAIGAGEFVEFDVSVGPVPDVASLMFPATQTYSDGEVVAWDEPSTEGTEPQYPAPTLVVAPASGDAHGHDASTTTSSAAPSVAAAADHAASPVSTDSTARLLAVIGIVLGALGILVGAVAIRRGRPGTGTSG